MPRGPITPVGVVAAMTVGLVVGALARFVLRSRWAMLVTPVVFVVAVELGRIAVVGPTVDRPQVSTFFGVLVLVLGRGFHALVQVLPMVLGAAVGAGTARRLSHAPDPQGWRWAGRGVAAVVALALVALAVVLIRPGTTAPIVDAAGAARARQRRRRLGHAPDGHPGRRSAARGDGPGCATGGPIVPGLPGTSCLAAGVLPRGPSKR